jgi:hypothetical protein
MQLGGLPRSWRLNREPEGPFASRKRQEDFVLAGEEDGGEEEVRCTDPNMEDIEQAS